VEVTVYLAAQCPEKIDFSAERAEGFAAALRLFPLPCSFYIIFFEIGIAVSVRRRLAIRYG
jgi:hypothetical protein